jgi:hypothetical protein
VFGLQLTIPSQRDLSLRKYGKIHLQKPPKKESPVIVVVVLLFPFIICSSYARKAFLIEKAFKGSRVANQVDFHIPLFVALGTILLIEHLPERHKNDA